MTASHHLPGPVTYFCPRALFPMFTPPKRADLLTALPRPTSLSSLHSKPCPRRGFPPANASSTVLPCVHFPGFHRDRAAQITRTQPPTLCTTQGAFAECLTGTCPSTVVISRGSFIPAGLSGSSFLITPPTGWGTDLSRVHLWSCRSTPWYRVNLPKLSLCKGYLLLKTHP